MTGRQKTFLVVGIVGLLGAAAFLGSLVLYLRFKIPNFAQMRSSVEMDIRLANGQESTRKVGPRAPGWVPLELISDYVLMAVISSEDTTFYSHKGVDLHELQESIKKDIREKRWARGASTLTQQVVKNVFLSHEKTLWRKFREILWASELEKEFSKSEILCFYLNMAEFGPGIYGIGQAATYYFGVVPSRLSVREAAFLAMLLPSPRKYHAYFRTKTLTPWATSRVNHIVTTMEKLGYIDEAAKAQALGESLWGTETEGPGGEVEPLGDADEGAVDLPEEESPPPLTQEPTAEEAPDSPPDP
jgi:monofunctional glycosyltransferase